VPRRAAISNFKFQISNFKFDFCNLQFAICNLLLPPFRRGGRGGCGAPETSSSAEDPRSNDRPRLTASFDFENRWLLPTPPTPSSERGGADASDRTYRLAHALILVLCLSLIALTSGSAYAQADSQRSAANQAAAEPRLNQPPLRPVVDVPVNDPALQPPLIPGVNVDQALSPGGLSASLKVMLLLTVLSLAPSILIMTTCFIRFVIVLGLLRQAIGTQQAPPNQVIVSLCLFLTFMVMSPVWQQAYDQGIRPYTNPVSGELPLSFQTAFERTVAPLREFMSDQIERAGNSDGVWMFLEYQRPDPNSEAGRRYVEPADYDDVPLSVLVPSYILSELKSAFIIGFQIYLPFLVIDMVVSSVLTSMGMMMLPPVLISIPFKLLLFVLIDGWYLTVGMLLESVRPFG
jgi:flagellar biosynthesis protein FliP